MMRLALARFAASTSSKSSIKLSVGGKVDCTMATSFPLIVSSMLTVNSPSLKRVVLTGTNSPPNDSATF